MNNCGQDLEVNMDIDEIYSRYDCILTIDKNSSIPTVDIARLDYPFTVCNDGIALDFYISSIII